MLKILIVKKMQFIYVQFFSFLKSHNTLIIISFFLISCTFFYIYMFHLYKQSILQIWKYIFFSKIQNRKRYLHIRHTRQLHRKVLFVRRNEEWDSFHSISELFMNGNWVEKVKSPLWTVLNIIYLLSFLSEIY